MVFNCKQGDLVYLGLNFCVVFIECGLYYVVQVEFGCFGIFVGLKIDVQVCVLDGGGQLIFGLYVVGVDMVSLFVGYYFFGGINLGLVLIFGYIVGCYIVGVFGYEQE